MKNIILLITLTIGHINADSAQWTLVNPDTKTKGVTTMKFTESNGGKVYVKIWASCSPRDCYWGNFPIKPLSSYEIYEFRRASPSARWLPAYRPLTIDQSFVKRKLEVRRNRRNTSLFQLVVSSDYKNPNRKDTGYSYSMELK